jgi:hypothetical protein
MFSNQFSNRTAIGTKSNVVVKCSTLNSPENDATKNNENGANANARRNNASSSSSKNKPKIKCQVFKRTPPKKLLGLCFCADDVQCGDSVEVSERERDDENEREMNVFVISRVTKSFKMQYGRYVEDGRKLEVETLERDLLNRQLRDVLRRS